MVDPRIHVQGFPLTLAISAWAESSTEVALERYADELVAIDVYLKDINGPRGGEDKSALIRVQLKSRPPVVVESVSDDLYVAIDLSARRIRHAVGRALTRNRQLLRDRSRRHRRMPIPAPAVQA